MPSIERDDGRRHRGDDGKFYERPERRFIFQLALALGLPVGVMLSNMSSRELSEWMAFAREEPFGERRADLRAGIVASTIAEVHRDHKKRHKPFTAPEFMPKFWDRGGAEQDWTDQLMIIETLNMAFGGQDLRPKQGGEGDGEA